MILVVDPAWPKYQMLNYLIKFAFGWLCLNFNNEHLRLHDLQLSLKDLGHSILGNFSTDQIVIELT